MANVSFMPHAPEGGPAPLPTVFTRTISTASGPPWEQARAAMLDARHGAPLPIGEVVFRLRRLEPWAPGRPGRHAAFYVRQRELTERFATTVEVDGRPVAVEFRPAADHARTLRGLALGAAVAVATIAVGLGGAMLAFETRSGVEDALQGAERSATIKLRQIDGLQRRQDEDQRLRAAVSTSRPVSQVLADLTWASAQRAPDARLAAIHWDHGLLAIETRGEASPLPDVAGLRPGGRIRPGVWLWGVQPPARPQAAAQALAASPTPESAP